MHNVLKQELIAIIEPKGGYAMLNRSERKSRRILEDVDVSTVFGVDLLADNDGAGLKSNLKKDKERCHPKNNSR